MVGFNLSSTAERFRILEIIARNSYPELYICALILSSKDSHSELVTQQQPSDTFSD